MRNGVARCLLVLLLVAAGVLAAGPAYARQTGSIAGKVIGTDGSALPA